MKKNLLTVALLAAGITAQAQLTYVGNDALMTVQDGALVYNGGGMQLAGTGKVSSMGDVMIVGSNTDAFSVATPGNFILDYLNPNTYGQLYITGLQQSSIDGGQVTKRYRADQNSLGYQQVGLPFSKLAFSTLGTQLGTNFSNDRYNGSIHVWNNQKAEGANQAATYITSTPTAYYQVDVQHTTNGRPLWVPAATIKDIVGIPYADNVSIDGIALTGAATQLTGGTYGAGGKNKNSYKELYNTYMYDNFTSSVTWATYTGAGSTDQVNFAKNIYQFGNPFLTNLDLSKINVAEAGTVTDNNNITNLRGIIWDFYTQPWSSSTGTQYVRSQFKIVTWDDAGNASGDIGEPKVIKPLGIFVLKLKDNNPATLNFSNLRRFAQTERTTASYDVTASRVNGQTIAGTTARYSQTTTAKSGSAGLKQITVYGLSSDGTEVARTHFVVGPNAKTGVSSEAVLQASAGISPDETNQSNQIKAKSLLYTREESLSGDISTPLKKIELYINEANSSDYYAKQIALVADNAAVSKLKFQVFENSQPVEQLSSDSFYFYQDNRKERVKTGSEILLTSDKLGLAYGDETVLGADSNTAISATSIAYNQEAAHHEIIFKTGGKTADVEVYDMSGKLVANNKKVNASTNFVLDLPRNSSVYIIKITYSDGEIVAKKILNK